MSYELYEKAQSTVRDLTDEHLSDLIDNHAIKPEYLADIRSWGKKGDMGIVIPWNDGVTSYDQFRLDPSKREKFPNIHKYFGPEGVSVINHLREPEGPDDALVIVEGTLQHRAVASWLPEKYGVYGIYGCNGYSGQDLSTAEDRDVYVFFDADMETNRNVWEAARKLQRVLKAEGAKSIKFVMIPGKSKEGADDVLAHRAPEKRTSFLLRLIEQATENIGRPPARKATGGDVKKVAEKTLANTPMALTRENRVSIYRDGVYRLDPGAFNALMTEVLGDEFTRGGRDNMHDFIAGQLKLRGLEIPERTKEPLLNVANGMLDLRTGELRDHNPKYLSSAQIPIAWDENAECPTYEEWLRKQAGNQADDLEEVISTMLDPSRTPAKAGILYGPSRSGKSTIIRIAEAIAGGENSSAVTLMQLSTNRFAAIQVYGKMLNSASELRSGHVEDIAIFKQMTGNDPIEAERKHVQGFKFYNKALFLFATNELPTIGESSRAYSERMKPFKFGNSFAGKEDQSIEDKIMQELPGILVRWVKAWQRLNARGHYLETAPEVRQDFETRSDRVQQFLSECCVVVAERADGVAVSPGMLLPPHQVATKRDIARSFGIWAERQNGSKIGERKIIDRLTSINGVVEVRRADTKTRGFNITILPADQWGEVDQVAEVAVSTPTAASDENPFTESFSEGD